MKSVAVLNTHKAPQPPVHPAEARRMLRNRQAAVYRRHPFTIILPPAPAPSRATQRRQRQIPAGQLMLFPSPAQMETVRNLRLKIDPGSRYTGLAVVDDHAAQVVWAGELEHRSLAIKKAMDKRRALRRGRRNRHTRYRKPRFDNRRRNGVGCHRCGGNPQSGKSLCRPCQKGWSSAAPRYHGRRWLPPSLMSRLQHIQTWVRRLTAAFPIGAISVEVNRFDQQLAENPNIKGVEYQRGTLHGYEVREYLLLKYRHRCVYCQKNGRLEVEHTTPKSRGGSDRIGNLAIACRECNQKKGNRTAEEFGHPGWGKNGTGLRDMAAMNACRYALPDLLAEFALPVEIGTGGRTKYNRTRAGLDKSHWADAACVGASTPERWRTPRGVVVQIKSGNGIMSKRGRRQVTNVDAQGFPAHARPGKGGVRSKPSPPKKARPYGWQTGDIVSVYYRTGKWAGRTWRGRIVVRTNGSFAFAPTAGGKTVPTRVSVRQADFRLLDRPGRYSYSYRAA